MNDRELILAINQAIPLRTCPQDRANDISRRAWLLQQVKKYVEKQLENQFNAKKLDNSFDDGYNFPPLRNGI